MRLRLLSVLLGLALPAWAMASEGLDRTYTVTVSLTQLVGIQLHPVRLHCEEDGDNRTPATVIKATSTQVVQEDRWTSTGRFPVHCQANQQTLTVDAPQGRPRTQGNLDLRDAPAHLSVRIIHD